MKCCKCKKELVNQKVYERIMEHKAVFYCSDCFIKRMRNLIQLLSNEAGKELCNHKWLELHGHPAGFKCEKCGKLEEHITNRST